MSAAEVMDLLRQARLERREDLDGVMDAHIGNTATSILLLNQAQINARLLGADPNTEVDVPGEVLDSTLPDTPQESS